MGPQSLIDTSHLTKHIDAMGKSMASNVDMPPGSRSARLALEFVQRQSAQIIDLGVALGCAAFAMGIVIGVYLLLQSL